MSKRPQKMLLELILSKNAKKITFKYLISTRNTFYTTYGLKLQKIPLYQNPNTTYNCWNLNISVIDAFFKKVDK